MINMNETDRMLDIYKKIKNEGYEIKQLKLKDNQIYFTLKPIKFVLDNYYGI